MQYSSKEELEIRYAQLCEEGNFGDELLELMELLDNWVEPSMIQETTTHYLTDKDEGPDSDELKKGLISSYHIRLNEYTEDSLNLGLLYESVQEKGLSDEDFKDIVTGIINQAKDKYDCYLMPKDSIYANKLSQDVWEWVHGDSILFSRNPLYLDIQKCKVDLSKYSPHIRGIGYGIYLMLWTQLGCKFVMNV